MLLNSLLAPTQHHFGATVEQAILFVLGILSFVAIHFLWPHNPDDVMQDQVPIMVERVESD